MSKDTHSCKGDSDCHDENHLCKIVTRCKGPSFSATVN